MKTAPITYLIITSVLFFGLNAYVSSHATYANKTSRIDSNYAQLQEKSSQIESEDEGLTVVIGNSFVNASFSSALVGDNFVNFTVAGMPLADAVTIVETLPEDANIDRLLIGIGYNDAIPIISDSSAYQRHQTDNLLKQYWLSIPLVRGQSMITTMIKEDVKCLLAKTKNRRCASETALNQNKRKPKNKAVNSTHHLHKIKKSTEEKYKEFKPYTVEVSETFVDYIARLKTAAAEQNIELFLYTAPIYSELKAQLKTSTIENFRQVMRETDVHYIDLNLVMPDLPHDCFVDASHLGKSKGTPLATEKLKQFIESNTTI